MKNFRWKKAFTIGALQVLMILATGCNITISSQHEHGETGSTSEVTEVAGIRPVSNTTSSKQKIMLALLLDTSGSMDGLIDQAKSQLWAIVNELAAAKDEGGAQPELSIALYEYGNDGLPAGEGYLRMVTPLTTDLDEISEKLFALSKRN